jgi:plasmid stability protein
MSTLHVRNIPGDVYDALRERAEANNSSISSETIRLLKRALRTDKIGLRELFDNIEGDRPVAKTRTRDIAELIREDRNTR